MANIPDEIQVIRDRAANYIRATRVTEGATRHDVLQYIFGPLIEWIDAQPRVPQPDWDNAPEWAMVWAVDEDGEAYWYDRVEWPEDHHKGGCWETYGNKCESAGYVELNSYNWKHTRRDRPEADND